MKIDCHISCYNYRDYVCEAIRSALNQTHTFDSIIVVDDGSTDGSAETIEREFCDSGQVQLIRQSNAGQLSCFNTACETGDGDIICFLDADDLYHANYLESLIAVYEQRREVDFIFTGHELFGDVNGLVAEPESDFDFGYTALQTYYLRPWIGAPTSCLSMRRSLFDRILPIPFVSEWKTRADDCLVFGASLMGGRKFRLGAPLVRYRVHDSNNFYGQTVEAASEFPRRLSINRLFEFLTRGGSLCMKQLAESAVDEFASQPGPWSYRRLRRYLKILRRAELPWRSRWSIGKKLWRLYLRQPRVTNTGQNESNQTRRAA